MEEGGKSHVNGGTGMGRGGRGRSHLHEGSETEFRNGGRKGEGPLTRKNMNGGKVGVRTTYKEV